MQPAIAASAIDADAEDSAYLRVLELLDAGRRDEAWSAAAEYLARYPRGFRRLEARNIVQRLERSR